MTFLLCSRVKTLGESDDEGDSAAAWVMKSRQLEKDRQLADQRVRLFVPLFLLIMALTFLHNYCLC